MADNNFVDYVKIYCKSGKGGGGSVHFRRDKLTAKGGPDGGDGGKGGSIILVGNKQMWTLLPLKFRKHVIASDGASGKGAQKSGVNGEDIILEVPLGTVARDFETYELLFEISEHNERKVLLQGGMGGLGNVNFKSSTNQSPQYAQPGIQGLESTKVLELKLLADIGLVGFPNVGKSTLLAAITAAKPKIANYEFTTLAPNLGIVKYRDNRSFVMADIPGIIEKAHEGKGLGLRFLRHIERNSVLLFIIPADAEDLNKQYKILLNELKEHNPELLHKPKFIAISKFDLIDDELKEMIEDELDFGDIPHMFFSAITRRNLVELKDELWKIMNKKR